ncbi:hypothetical protein Tco_0707135 [Tanacetum coccineum]|uniref:Uncharacterized protein n=1 Tax=Tanacetum coccineum TaxID=301880 RepID=A0ABQ4Y9D1_9ASTR
MMTYLKHVGGKKHSKLKTKTFEEIHVLYERLKRQDQNFKRLKKRVVNEEDTTKVPAKQEATKQGTKKRKSGHVKMIARKRPRPQPDDDSDDEHRKFLRITTFESTIDSEIMEKKSFIARLHKYSEITPEDIELILWGDLKIMMESSIEENDQDLKDGTVIYMLVERKYPLSKELLQQMLDLGLEVKEESTTALQLLKRIELITTSYCPGVLGGNTYKGYITARMFLEGTPTRGALLPGCSWRGHLQGVHYCPGVLGGDTYKGYITARVFLEGTPVTGVHILFINAGCSWRGHLR